MFLGLGMQRARLVDYGFFVADTWRWKPNFTLNLGLRYDLQLPFYPRNNSYSKATVADVWGRSGVGNLFSPGGLTGQAPTFSQYDEGEGAYDTDLNNWAPNVGVAWTLGGNPGFLGTLLGKDAGDSVLRAGYSMGYNRPGTSDFTGAIANNPGVSLSANRNHALGNLGTPGSIFLRNRADVGPPANMPTTRVYPMSDVITGDITVFEPGLQVPYGMTWTGGWQRKVGSSMVVEARYVGTRSLQSWQTYNYNEINIVENGFLNEFRLAQQNLEANRAANLGNTFRYTGAPGTSPLPIFLAHFQGLPASAAGNPASYSTTNANWTNNTFLGYLAKYNPTPYNFANTGNDRLIGNGTFRNNALTAGLPANFFQANPDLIGGANIVGNGGATYYNSLQLELRKRLAQGLQFQTSYVYGKTVRDLALLAALPASAHSGHRRRKAESNHAFRANWVYELPFGQGRRFASGAGTVDESPGWRLVVRRDRAAPERHDARLRQRAPGRHVGEGTAGLRSSCGSTTRASSSTCCRRTSSTTPSGLQHQRHLGHRLQRSRRADGTLPGAGQRAGLHRSRADQRAHRQRRLRRAQRSSSPGRCWCGSISARASGSRSRATRTSSSAPSS